MAIDRFGRSIGYLRISLTDRCNLRCVYCMPEEMTFRPRADLMQDEELLRLVRLFTRLGFHKFRLTGGEPTLRPHLPALVRAIAQMPGVQSLSMTTNGILLKKLAAPLAEAGLQRVNVSLDTLDSQRFRRVTRWGRVEDVLEGLKAAEEAGLEPIKINTVVMRGYNEEDIVPLARLTLTHAWHVRFIEMMPFAGPTDLQQQAAVRAPEMRARIEAALGPLQGNGKLDGEARLYRLQDAPGMVGFISTLSQPFCASCTRARLTADGRLRMCLLREYEVDLLTPMRQGASNEALRQLILDAVWHKPWGHALGEDIIPLNRVMSEIGG
ncbi:MAG: GTP 3',8-cyclase MoaA [Anaerolineae bacterium]|nr:MAG: GTP 3',8-cyclase MoaA [Anaerolineae bacterium]